MHWLPPECLRWHLEMPSLHSGGLPLFFWCSKMWCSHANSTWSRSLTIILLVTRAQNSPEPLQSQATVFTYSAVILAGGGSHNRTALLLLLLFLLFMLHWALPVPLPQFSSLKGLLVSITALVQDLWLSLGASFLENSPFLVKCQSWLAQQPVSFLLWLQTLTPFKKLYFSSETLLNSQNHPESNPKLFCRVCLSPSPGLKTNSVKRFGFRWQTAPLPSVLGFKS